MDNRILLICTEKYSPQRFFFSQVLNMSIAKYSHLPNGHSFRKVYEIAEKMEWDKQPFLITCFLWAGEKQGMQTWKEFSPSFKKLHRHERNEGVAGRRRSKDRLWLLMFILYYTLCNRISDYWSTLPDSISSSPLRVEIADWDKLKVPSSSCLKLLFQGIAFSLLLQCHSFALRGCNCKMDGGKKTSYDLMCNSLWCVSERFMSWLKKPWLNFLIENCFGHWHMCHIFFDPKSVAVIA